MSNWHVTIFWRGVNATSANGNCVTILFFVASPSFFSLIPRRPLFLSLALFFFYSSSSPSFSLSLTLSSVARPVYQSLSLRQNHLQPSLSLPPAILWSEYPQHLRRSPLLRYVISSLVTTPLSLSSLCKLSQTRVGFYVCTFIFDFMLDFLCVL